MRAKVLADSAKPPATLYLWLEVSFQRGEAPAPAQ